MQNKQTLRAIFKMISLKCQLKYNKDFFLNFIQLGKVRAFRFIGLHTINSLLSLKLEAKAYAM